MTTRDERGMVTAEYTVGTLGAVCIALILCKCGMVDGDNPWLQSFKEIIQRALAWRDLVDFIPGLGLRLG